jgi:hypothetical protein
VRGRRDVRGVRALRVLVRRARPRVLVALDRGDRAALERFHRRVVRARRRVDAGVRGGRLAPRPPRVRARPRVRDVRDPLRHPPVPRRDALAPRPPRGHARGASPRRRPARRARQLYQYHRRRLGSRRRRIPSRRRVRRRIGPPRARPSHGPDAPSRPHERPRARRVRARVGAARPRREPRRRRPRRRRRVLCRRARLRLSLARAIVAVLPGGHGRRRRARVVVRLPPLRRARRPGPRERRVRRSLPRFFRRRFVRRRRVRRVVLRVRVRSRRRLRLVAPRRGLGRRPGRDPAPRPRADARRRGARRARGPRRGARVATEGPRGATGHEAEDAGVRPLERDDARRRRRRIRRRVRVRVPRGVGRRRPRWRRVPRGTRRWVPERVGGVRAFRRRGGGRGSRSGTPARSRGWTPGGNRLAPWTR